MDYKNTENKVDFKNFQKNIIKKLEDFLNKLSSNDKTYKNSVLVAYWLKDYTNMLQREPNFNPYYLPTYKRGSILSVNLGYRIGKEHGGLHYCIVLSPNDSKKSHIITVVPLSSVKTNKKTQDFQYYLGNAFYKLIEERKISYYNMLSKNIEELDRLITTNHSYFNDLIGEKIASSTMIEDAETIYQLTKTVVKIRTEIKKIDEQAEKIKKIKYLKSDSIVLLNQVTTISKMRIVSPTKKDDPIYDIIIPEEIMNNISSELTKYL